MTRIAQPIQKRHGAKHKTLPPSKFHTMAHFTDFQKEDIQNGMEFSNFIDAII